MGKLLQGMFAAGLCLALFGLGNGLTEDAKRRNAEGDEMIKTGKELLQKADRMQRGYYGR